MVSEHAAIISQELNLGKRQVASTLRLLNEGATIPFIARYRKEVTNGLDEVIIHTIAQRKEALEELDKRKAYILETIESQGALTPELRQRIEDSLDPLQVEDIFMPYRPKRRTKATVAREMGLEPLAKQIMAQTTDDARRLALPYLSDEVVDVDTALNGAQDIIAEWVSDNEKARAIVRSKYQRGAIITSKLVSEDKREEGSNYQNYFDFSEPLRLCASHRYLAMRRGESEGILKVSLNIDDAETSERLCRMFVRQRPGEDPEKVNQVAEVIRRAVKDGYRRLLRPSIETEIAQAAKEKSDTAAISMFADNVRQLLMAAPLGRKRVMGIDPGFNTGCKVACLDEQGNLLAHDIIFPTPPANDFYGATDTVCYLVDRYRIDAIAVGTGSGGRDTENFLRSIQYPRKITIYSVNEDGASIYSASEIARREFPDLDITIRSAVSIGRRLLDPLAELVKIEPRSIGVGQYQHDVNKAKLKESLDYTVSSCVNQVGVNVNTASRELLSYVSGIGPVLATNIVAYRAENGNFKSRQELMNVPRMGEKAFQQCAGFLRIPGASNPLDNTAVHPERYELIEQMAADMNTKVERLVNDKNLLHNIELDRYITKKTGLPTLTDIIQELEKPGRDPRERNDSIEFDDNIRGIEDLHLGMVLTGKVTNLTAFGVFVDIGLKCNGLIHISQLSDKFITSPADVVTVGQVVRVKVIDVDANRARIALTLKDVPQR
ncbi:MAG: RNA-binding transcriptional accessory protein [Bacteroidales bacterium]|nr:RNA-binding transcriptional accessory protein [Bacteroidales bacterium]